MTKADIKNINELYLQCKTYAQVARLTGFSPSTVKKYVIPGYTHVEENNIIRFNEPIPDFYPNLFVSENWADLCVLTDREREGIAKLWEELEL